MAYIAGVGNLQRIRFRRTDEVEGVAADVDITNGLRDLGHVTFNALITRAARFVVRMLFYRGRVRSVGRIRA